MLKTRIVLLLVGGLLIWLIFLLPKSVVENESQLKEEAGIAPSSHSEVPATLSASIRSVRAQFAESPANQKNAIFADSLRTLYTQAGQFDSAAWFAERAATFFNTSESYLNAGNSYYEAYSFAMEPAKQEQLAEKTRFWLGKILDANPKNLEVKTKMAMTYLSSKAPMQGITMMREVLAEDPKNEFALFNMGMLSIQSGQYDRAIERLEELKAINPNHVQGQLLLGVAYMNKGNKVKAREQFEIVKKLDQDPAVQATADSYLKDLE
ncbi:MAG: tetratricopeptide repeat protein [Flammeovirgaceae bacterium]|jgi:tetratricopeptide (TPR) repeat protein|nr:tetratricopeptide repeat protein [Flammeovirgaceae bacterium]